MDKDSLLYLPLDEPAREIRLLRIEPQEGTKALIQCHLATESLNYHPVYKALSYTWGDPKVTEPILVGATTVDITTNLHSLLCALRTANEQCAFWVDALCINQNDTKERNQQVKIMADIFSTADHVYAWLGSGDEDTRTAFSLVADWTVDLDSTVDGVRHFLSDITDAFPEDWVRKILPRLLDDEYASITAQDDMFRCFDKMQLKPYWRRVWIQQEILLAPIVTLLCGSDTLSFNRLLCFHGAFSKVSVAATRQGNIHALPNIFKSFRPPPFLMSTGIQTRDLWNLLRISRYCASTDPRDRIYGILGLQPDSQIYIPVDYDNPVASIYSEVVRIVAKETGFLLVDGSNGVGNQEILVPIEQLPSWAPDFRLRPTPYPAREAPSNILEISFGNRFTQVKDIEFSDAATLEVTGAVVDKVTGFVQTNDGGHDQVWEFAKANLGISCPDGVPMLQALFRCMLLLKPDDRIQQPEIYRNAIGFIALMIGLADRSSEPFHPKFVSVCKQDDLMELIGEKRTWCTRFLAATGLVDHLAKQLERVKNEDHMPEWSEKELLLGFWGHLSYDNDFQPAALAETDVLSAYSQFLEERWWVNWKQTFYVTSKGYVGVGPPHIADGDLVSVFLGSATPLLIRATGSTYQVVGASFVSALTDERVVTMLESGEIALQTLCLT